MTLLNTLSTPELQTRLSATLCRIGSQRFVSSVDQAFIAEIRTILAERRGGQEAAARQLGDELSEAELDELADPPHLFGSDRM